MESISTVPVTDPRSSAPVRTAEAPVSFVDATTEEDAARARLYALLSNLLARPMGADILAALAALQGDDGSDIGRALAALGAAARGADATDAEEEFSALFYGMGAGGELQPYGSFYRTGLVYDKPLADLRSDLARMGIAAREGTTEPEDHAAFLCEVMHGLIVGTFGGAYSLDVQRGFFRAHLAPWIGRFFADLEKAKSARFYAAVGALGRLFMDIEGEGFAADA